MVEKIATRGEIEMKCDYCDQHWIAVAPVSATALECPECHKMTPVRTAVAYSTTDPQFTYIEDGIPEPGVMVLGAWTNGDEFHVAPSVWDDDAQCWLEDSNDVCALGSDYYLYAWAKWPDAPPL